MIVDSNQHSNFMNLFSIVYGFLKELSFMFGILPEFDTNLASKREKTTSFLTAVPYFLCCVALKSIV